MGKKIRKKSYNGASRRECYFADNTYREAYQGYLYDCASKEYDTDEW